MNARIVIIEQTDSPTVAAALEGMIKDGKAAGHWTLLDTEGGFDKDRDLPAVGKRLGVPCRCATMPQILRWQSSDERAVIVDLLTNLSHLLGRAGFIDAAEMALTHHTSEINGED